MALKLYLNISVLYRVRIHNLFPDDCSSHRDIHALPFYRLDINVVNSSVSQYIKTPVTLGDKIRKRRLELKMPQKDIASFIGVCVDSITFWENNRVRPMVKHFPKIIEFLNYYPFEIDLNSLPGKLKYFRNQNGLSHFELAKLLNVDETTAVSWEKGKTPHAISLKKLFSILEKNQFL